MEGELKFYNDEEPKEVTRVFYRPPYRASFYLGCIIETNQAVKLKVLDHCDNLVFEADRAKEAIQFLEKLAVKTDRAKARKEEQWQKQYREKLRRFGIDR